jgi:hypothetical protein
MRRAAAILLLGAALLAVACAEAEQGVRVGAAVAAAGRGRAGAQRRTRRSSAAAAPRAAGGLAVPNVAPGQNSFPRVLQDVPQVQDVAQQAQEAAAAQEVAQPKGAHHRQWTAEQLQRDAAHFALLAHKGFVGARRGSGTTGASRPTRPLPRPP